MFSPTLSQHVNSFSKIGVAHHFYFQQIHIKFTSLMLAFLLPSQCSMCFTPLHFFARKKGPTEHSFSKTFSIGLNFKTT